MIRAVIVRIEDATTLEQNETFRQIQAVSGVIDVCDYATYERVEALPRPKSRRRADRLVSRLEASGATL